MRDAERTQFCHGNGYATGSQEQETPLARGLIPLGGASALMTVSYSSLSTVFLWELANLVVSTHRQITYEHKAGTKHRPNVCVISVGTVFEL